MNWRILYYNVCEHDDHMSNLLDRQINYYHCDLYKLKYSLVYLFRYWRWQVEKQVSIDATRSIIRAIIEIQGHSHFLLRSFRPFCFPCREISRKTLCRKSKKVRRKRKSGHVYGNVKYLNHWCQKSRVFLAKSFVFLSPSLY